jgi:hypothetical protein
MGDIVADGTLVAGRLATPLLARYCEVRSTQAARPPRSTLPRAHQRNYQAPTAVGVVIDGSDARPTDHADIIVHNDAPQQPAWEARTL